MPIVYFFLPISVYLFRTTVTEKFNAFDVVLKRVNALLVLSIFFFMGGGRGRPILPFLILCQVVVEGLVSSEFGQKSLVVCEICTLNLLGC